MQVLCKAEHVHYTLWPVESYEEMKAISSEEFEDDAVRPCSLDFAPVHMRSVSSNAQAYASAEGPIQHAETANARQQLIRYRPRSTMPSLALYCRRAALSC